MRDRSGARAGTGAGTRGGWAHARRGVALALLLGASHPVHADGAPEGECDIQLDARMSVYMVMVEGAPYRDKRYLTWDDALKLRDVLVSAGACDRAAAPKPCTLELAAAGNYVLLRDGVNFDPYAELRTLKAARTYARSLERARLCKPVR